MIEKNRPPVASLLRALVWMALPVGAAIAQSACTGMGLIDDPSRVVSYEYRPQLGYVRIERIEADAPNNAQPFAVSADALRQSLASLQVEGGSSIGATAVFTGAQLDEIVPYLVAALAKAGPKEDVTFAVIGRHGALGAYGSRSVTTGRLFARDGQLNLIFGLMQELFEPFTELSGDNSSLVPPFPPGSRNPRPDRVWKLVPKSGHLADGRADWIVLDTTQPTVAKEKAAGAAAPTPADSRYQEIENKLTVLNRLKEKGLITEGEYQERRRAILQGL